MCVLQGILIMLEYRALAIGKALSRISCITIQNNLYGVTSTCVCVYVCVCVCACVLEGIFIWLEYRALAMGELLSRIPCITIQGDRYT